MVGLGQVDPVPRDLIQVGYNGSFEGHAPLAAYAYYLHNEPGFLRTNLTLRLALAPVYLDTELGISQALGRNTDVGIGIAGGGFADNYDEVDDGVFIPAQSFLGHCFEGTLGLYHRLNPERRIPLNFVLRGQAHWSYYSRDETDPDFRLPNNRCTGSIRVGLRWGGKEPLLFPDLAMELSAWYEGGFRTDSGLYGYPTNGLPGDRQVNPSSHLFWGQALLAYTVPSTEQAFYVNVTAGTSVHADRFSAYRLGGMLPLVSEFPLWLPGYFYKEFSARQFLLAGANCMLPLDRKHRWNFNLTATTAVVDYLPGLEQPGHSLTGVGAGLLYRTPGMKVMVGYGYGIDAIRSDGRGAHTVGVLLQLDLKRAEEILPGGPDRWRGFQRFLGSMFN